MTCVRAKAVRRITNHGLELNGRNLTDLSPLARIEPNIQDIPVTQAMSFPSSPSEAEQTPGFGRLAKPETPLLSNRRPVHELPADSLRLTMMAGYHLPGVRLNQEDLALDYGVSGLRVREALLNLQSEGRVV